MRLWNPINAKKSKPADLETRAEEFVHVGGTSYLGETSEGTQKSWPFTPRCNSGCGAIGGAKEKARCTFFLHFPPFWQTMKERWVMSNGCKEYLLTTISLQNHNTCFLKTQSMLVSFLKLSLLFCLKLWVAMRPVVAVLIEHNAYWALVVKWGSERDH